MSADTPNCKGQFAGPLEAGEWPETLCARVVTPGDEPRVHGYDVESDIARHYRFTEFVLLSLTGELPSTEAAAAFDVVMTFLAPVSVAHASAHAAVVARLCGAEASTTVGVAAISLGEQARHLMNEHDELLRWLARPDGDLPPQYGTQDTAESSAVERLRAAIMRTGLCVPGLALHPTRAAALLCVLWACGLARREMMEAAIVLSRMPTTIAEAFAERVANFREYPVNLPRFRYEEGT